MALDHDPVAVAGGADENSPTEQRTPRALADYWLRQIQAAEKKRKPYITRGRQILRRYKNKRTLTTLGVPIANRRMNVLWSNVQTQKPVLYAQTPNANVSRRNKTKDPIGRTAAIVLENCLQNSIAMEDFDFVMSQVVEDRLLPGAGVAIVEYVPQVEQDQVGWQAAETRYIHWEDWVTNPARVWQENWFFAYRVYLTRRQCYDIALSASGDEAFARDVWTEITLDHKAEPKDGDGQRDDSGPAKATVWVIWDRTDKQVIQIAPGYPAAPLAVLEPPVNFDQFWPVPRPLQSTTTNDSTIPVPDFEQYVDQADEIDLMTQRIGVLSKALKVRGLYPADMDSLKALMDGGDADLIPYDQFALLQERGGANGLVVWFPTEAIAKTLVHCIELRQQAIEIMYEITGISDIMRGATEASETATAQHLKAQFGGVRIRESQKDVQRFIRDILRLKAEIICEHFTLEVIQAMSGVNLLTDQQKAMVQQAVALLQRWQQAAAMAQQQGLPPPPQPAIPQPTPEMIVALKEPSWEQVMGLLRNEKLRGFVVDVETDSTIEPDQQAQQQAAVEFTGAVAQFMTAALPILQVEPLAADFIGELMAWTTRQWKGADTIESAVDEFVEALKKKAQQPPSPSPEMIQAQTDQQVAQVGLQTAQVKAGAEQQKAQIELAGTVLEHQHAAARLSQEQQAAQADHERAMELGAQQHQQAMAQAKARPKEASQ